MSKFDYSSLETFLSADNLKDYLRQVKMIPSATKEVNFELASRIKNGDSSAREEMIIRNLGLVNCIALSDTHFLYSYEKLDSIHDGIIGLINAVDKYDLNLNVSFSTYARDCINNAITRGRLDNDRIVRRPIWFVQKIKEYEALLSSCKNKGIEVPKPEIICEMLEISCETLDNIKNDSLLATISLNTPVYEEDDSNFVIEDTVSMEDLNYRTSENNIQYSMILAFLKTHFGQYYYHYYYIIYHSILKNSPSGLEEIAKELCFSRENVRKIKMRSLKRIRNFFINDSFSGKLDSVTLAQVNNSEFKFEPIEPEDIVKFLFIRKELSDALKHLYKAMYLSDLKYSRISFCKKFNLQIWEVISLEKDLDQFLYEFFSNNAQNYIVFKKNVLTHYKSSIFSVDLDNVDVENFFQATVIH